MPVETRISAEFGRLVTNVMEGDSFGKASIKTKISPAWLKAMADGRVPSLTVLNRFVEGYRYKIDSKFETELRVAAGYEKPTKLESALVKYRIEGKMTAEKEARIMEIVREVIEEFDGPDCPELQ